MCFACEAVQIKAREFNKADGGAPAGLFIGAVETIPEPSESS